MTFATSHSLSEVAASVHLIRPNEHLATLIPRSLWKPDSLSTSCDTFSCESSFLSFANFTFSFPVDFFVFERRHHCRKCGGIFCHKCTSRTTPLLDTRNLPFLSPPRNTSIYDFGSEGGIVDSLARVCDHCWDQLHGITKKTETPEPVLKPGVLSTLKTPRRSFVMTSGISESDAQCFSTSRVDTNSISLGELSAYPLCRSSTLCKASGGGRWIPRPNEAQEDTRIIETSFPDLVFLSASLSPPSHFDLVLSPPRRSRSPASKANRTPTLGIGKALWEVEWERKVQKVKRVLKNPVVREGDFCYRVYCGASSDDYQDEDVYDAYDSAELFSLSTF